jgi:hypothetical protein
MENPTRYTYDEARVNTLLYIAIKNKFAFIWLFSQCQIFFSLQSLPLIKKIDLNSIDKTFQYRELSLFMVMGENF